MIHKNFYFATGSHLRAARAMAGLKRAELAALARLHENSIKRLEAMPYISTKISPFATRRLHDALLTRGVKCGISPSPFIQAVPVDLANAEPVPALQACMSVANSFL